MLIFVCYATAFASIGMLLTTGLGENPVGVILKPQSWVFGLSAVAMEIFYFLLLGIVSPAEASLTLRLSIPASLFVGWLIIGRHISQTTLIGAAIVIAAVVPVFAILKPENQILAIALGIVCSFMAAIKTFSSEFHPTNRAAETVMDKMRVTGLVVLATAVIGLLLLSPIAFLTDAGLMPKSAMLPPMSGFWHQPTLVTAIILGAPLLLAMNYLTFSSSVKITTENFLATSAFTPLGALLLQVLASAAGLLKVPAFDSWLFVLIALGIVGVFLIIRDRA